MNKKTIHRQNSLRIIGGRLRNSKLNFPDIAGLRPTADRTRETLFNWLQNEIAGEDCLDLFAGSGALGIEALSRGARRVVFVDNGVLASAAILQNIERLKICDAEVNCSDACQWIEQQTKISAQFGVVFLDPPFASNVTARLCRQLANSKLLKPGCRIYVEAAASVDEEDMPENWRMLKTRQAGAVRYCLYMQEQLQEPTHE